MANLANRWEQIEYAPKAASTLFNAGYFISYDGIGGVIPAQSASLYGSATKILGQILEDITAADTDFTSTRLVGFQKALSFQFYCGVVNGPALASMIGSPFDVDGTDPSLVDVGAPGTQLKVVAVLSPTLVVVEAAEVEPIN